MRASKSFSQSNSSQKLPFFAVLMHALYGYPRYFKFKQKYQQYGPCFQSVFPFLMTIFPRIFLLENWLSTFFKNNIYSEKNPANKYMLNKRHRARLELFSKLARKQNDFTDFVRKSLLLTLNTFGTLRYTYFFFYKLLRSGLSPESCLYFQGFRSSKLLNGCLVV